MSDLTEFLLARIAEDEQAAQEEVDITARFFDDRFEVAYVWARTTRLESTGGSGTSFALGCPSPARVLAECKAKRRIVQDAINDVRDARRRPGWTIPDSEVSELGRRYRAGVEHQKAKQLPEALDRTERLLRLLALPYADHPDYDEAWRP